MSDHVRRLDLSKPSAARLYDHYLCGRHHYPVDKVFAARVTTPCPFMPAFSTPWSPQTLKPGASTARVALDQTHRGGDEWHLPTGVANFAKPHAVNHRTRAASTSHAATAWLSSETPSKSGVVRTTTTSSCLPKPSTRPRQRCDQLGFSKPMLRQGFSSTASCDWCD